MQIERNYGGLSAQERRDRRRAQLLAAGLESIGTRGWALTSVRGVSQLANLSPRFFYESFENLDALAVAVYEQVVSDGTARLIAAVAAAGTDRYEQARAAMRTIVDVLNEDPRLARVIFNEALGSEALAQRRRQTLHELAGVIGTLAEASYGINPHAKPLAEMTWTLLAGGIAELVAAWQDRSLKIDAEQLIEGGAELIVKLGDSAYTLSRAIERGSGATGRNKAGGT